MTVFTGHLRDTQSPKFGLSFSLALDLCYNLSQKDNPKYHKKSHNHTNNKRVILGRRLAASLVKKVCKFNRRIIEERGVEGWELKKKCTPLEGVTNGKRARVKLENFKKTIEISFQRNIGISGGLVLGGLKHWKKKLGKNEERGKEQQMVVLFWVKSNKWWSCSGWSKTLEKEVRKE